VPKPVNTDTGNVPDIITKKRENIHTDRCSNIRRQKFHAKGSGTEAKIQVYV
jgi:hypothetical protein